jgi:hypothetical protein
VDQRWLIDIFQECGLESAQAEQAAKTCLLRLLMRERPSGVGVERKSLVEHLIRDPLISMNRILGRGDGGLPLVEDETGALSVASIANILSDSGLDPVVSMAFAKVAAEAYSPDDFYQPLWKGLGHEGDVDYETLRREDWTPLRAQFADILPPDMRPTMQVRAQKPRAVPPPGTSKPPKD